ncbi:Peroxiredoxin [Micromonospora pattaloongensis]|uniref:Peroxiredoxin n=1 Tax=Micromonospora pattaloongensis TaxID=405436 RepID=A0A1H3RSJ5_9ACTN|nr:redoxin domain-containing protein [Micromonospora pattaloongensis]SDZ28305.1 Peroxiredoxin [Micromonospora pattaloongensis]
MMHGTDLPLPRTPAPDFTLPASPHRAVSLSSLRGRPVVLAFYPGDRSRVCGEQLALYQTLMPEFHQFGATVLGVSVDSVRSHRMFASRRGIRFDLLSDARPRGAVARRYGVYRPDDGFCERALFLIDGDGTIVYSHVSPREVNPGVDGILAAVEALALGASPGRAQRW